MKLSLIIFLVLLSFSCSIKNQLVGKYASKSNPNYFQFKNDSTYIYEYRAFHLYQYSTGKWSWRNKSSIEVNSNIKTTIIPLKLFTDKNTKGSNIVSIKFKIDNSNSLADYRCEVYMNGKLSINKRCDSLNYFNIDPSLKDLYFQLIKEPIIFSSTISSLPLKTERFFNIKAFEISNGIKINFSDSLYSYKSFNNEIINIGRNNIKLSKEFGSKDRKISKVSDEKNIFFRF